MLSEMDMEEAGMGMEEVSVSFKSDAGNNVAKGKRTKRRLKGLSPVTTAVMTSSSSSVSGCGAGSLEEEEEDMANCLILLAQGRGEGGDPTPPPPSHKDPCGDDGVHVNTHKSSTTKLDLYAYECKTCNRTFPSFQALGGHRASHKKPKLEDKNSSSPPPPPPHPSSQLFHFEEQKQRETKIINPSVSLQLGCGKNQGNKSKVHQCSICGSEFTSGQALGGHMRRHRASSTNVAVDVKPRNVLELDLNLPAPEEDLRDSNFHFPANQNSMMLSAAPALVGCHY